MFKTSALMFALIISSSSMVAAQPTLIAGGFGGHATQQSSAPIEQVQYRGGRGGYGGSSDLCQNWHRECARLYGYGTPRWNACMGQPAARYDCGEGGGRSFQRRGGYDRGYDRGYNRGYDDGGGRHFRRGGGFGSCRVWRRECANLYGRRSPQWHACMNQPGARRACSRGY
jgi:hypothetical protein